MTNINVACADEVVRVDHLQITTATTTSYLYCAGCQVAGYTDRLPGPLGTCMLKPKYRGEAHFEDRPVGPRLVIVTPGADSAQNPLKA